MQSFYWTDATHATRDAAYLLQLVRNGAFIDAYKILDNAGQFEHQIYGITGNYATLQFYSGTTKRFTFESSTDAYLSTWTAGGKIYFRPGAAGAGMNLGITALTLDSGVNLSIGGGTSAAIHAIKTTEQFRVGYDASNYYKTVVGSTGIVNLTASGSGASFIFNSPIQLLGQTTSSISPTSPNRTITMVVGGTTLYIPAKTTND